MLYLFLDESGDLGFDFVQKKPSNYFVVSILVIHGLENRKRLKIAIKRTIRKVNHKRNRSFIHELKGTSTILSIKQYCYKQAEPVEFSIYSLILDKRKAFERLARNKEHVYNYIARLLLDHVPIEIANSKVEFVVDRSKSKPEIEEFNRYIVSHLQDRLTPHVSLNMYHRDSQSIVELQLADLFAWGIFRKYESGDTSWYDIFKTRLHYEELYLG